MAFCNKHGILVEAYAPVGDGDRSHMRDAPIFAQLAAQHNVTVGQVILSWDLQSGADIVIPRSATAQHQVDNLNLFGPGGVPVVTLSSNEVAAISSNHTYGKVYHTDCKCVRARCLRWRVGSHSPRRGSARAQPDAPRPSPSSPLCFFRPAVVLGAPRPRAARSLCLCERVGEAEPPGEGAGPRRENGQGKACTRRRASALTADPPPAAPRAQARARRRGHAGAGHAHRRKPRRGAQRGR